MTTLPLFVEWEADWGREDASFIKISSRHGRNYMMSTSTPIQCPENCGIFVNQEQRPILPDGLPVILDNTFPHHIYNDGEFDRYVLMSECWYPTLSLDERDVLVRFFAAKDQFTVTDLKLAPWGYDDDSLEFALTTGAVSDLDFWKEIGYDRDAAKAAALLEKTSSKRKNNKRKSNSSSSKKKGFGGGGFGK